MRNPTHADRSARSIFEAMVDPDQAGETSYRAVYDAVSDAVDCGEDEYPEEDRRGLVVEELEAIIRHARAALQAFAMPNDLEREALTRAMSRAREGELEVDPNAIVSLSEDQGGVCGAYVEAWMWVDLEDENAEDEEDPCPMCDDTGVGPDGVRGCSYCGLDEEDDDA